jgi:hypothetical protein
VRGMVIARGGERVAFGEAVLGELPDRLYRR